MNRLHAPYKGTAIKSAWVCVLLVALGQCGRRTSPSFPGANVVLISIDTLRADHLPAYGYDRVDTPAIDAFAKEAILYERAYSQYPLTLPSHATLFTGDLPPQHGVRENGSFLKEDWETLAETLQKRGYHTAGFVSSVVLRARTGIAQGFEVYQDAIQSEEGDLLAARPGEETLALIQEWLQQGPGEPFFLFVHLYDPHTPYRAPEPFASRYEHPYDAEIARTDGVIGRLFQQLRELELYEDALVVVLSDHGEGLGDHGEETHGIFVYREAIHVPLLIKLPRGRSGGTRVSEPVGLMDFRPTVLSLLAIDFSSEVGTALIGENLSPIRPIYSESYIPLISYGWSPLKSAVQGPKHFIQAPKPELYDMVEDPGERQNLLPQQSVPATMRDFLQAVGEGELVQADLSDEDQALLESLGYVGRTDQPEGAEQRDPKDYIHQLQALEEGRRRRDGGEWDQAERVLNELLAENPAMVNARTTLAQILEARQKVSELESLYEEGLTHNPTYIPFMEPLVLVKLKLGKVGEAKTLAQFIHQHDHAGPNDKLSYFFYFYGETEHGLSLARATHARGDHLGYTSYVLGLEAAGNGNCREAVPHFEKAAHHFLSKREFRGAAFFQLGKCRELLGETDQAMAAYQSVLETHPDHGETRVNLALLHGARGARLDAIKVLDQWVADYPSREHYRTAAGVMKRLGYQDAAAFYENEAGRYPSDQPNP